MKYGWMLYVSLVFSFWGGWTLGDNLLLGFIIILVSLSILVGKWILEERLRRNLNQRGKVE